MCIVLYYVSNILKFQDGVLSLYWIFLANLGEILEKNDIGQNSNFQLQYKLNETNFRYVNFLKLEALENRYRKFPCIICTHVYYAP